MGIRTYISNINKLATPQSEQADPRQVENSTGGFSFAVDAWAQFDRFLILGTEGGSYYANERKLSKDNAKVVEACIQKDGPRAIKRIVEVSKGGLAPKNSPAIFALALACASPGPDVRREAFLAIPEVCRIGTHLFEFVQAVRTMRGLGKGLSKAITRWYTSRPADKLAYQLVKYQQRGGMSHKDVLRLTRRHGAQHELDPGIEAALRWAVAGPEGLGEREVSRRLNKGESKKTYKVDAEKLPTILAVHEELSKLGKDELLKACAIVQEHKLTHEMVPSHFLGETAMWDALLPHMPLHAMVRNLGRMTANGLLAPMSAPVQHVVEQLNAERIQKARLHPLQVLVALKTYEQGKGVKGRLTWAPDRQVLDALDSAFYESFKSVEPTGKRYLLALDVSGSMMSPEISGMPGISPRIGSAAMAMTTARVEQNWHCIGFFSGSGNWSPPGDRRTILGWGYGVSPLRISPRQRLDDVLKGISNLPFGGTDCSLPMLYAIERKLEVDCFVVYTDSETWAGNSHPHQALKQYRQKMGIDARLVVVGMVSNSFTIADPSDRGMLDVVGFSTDTPGVISSFAKGEF